MLAGELKKGDVIRAPWREHGDDVNMTGVVFSIRKGLVWVRWNADGDVTPEGTESSFPLSCEVEKV